MPLSKWRKICIMITLHLVQWKRCALPGGWMISGRKHCDSQMALMKNHPFLTLSRQAIRNQWQWKVFSPTPRPFPKTTGCVTDGMTLKMIAIGFLYILWVTLICERQIYGQGLKSLFVKYNSVMTNSILTPCIVLFNDIYLLLV